MEVFAFAADATGFDPPSGGDYRGGCMRQHVGLGVMSRARSPRATNMA